MINPYPKCLVHPKSCIHPTPLTKTKCIQFGKAKAFWKQVKPKARA